MGKVGRPSEPGETDGHAPTKGERGKGGERQYIKEEQGSGGCISG